MKTSILMKSVLVALGGLGIAAVFMSGGTPVARAATVAAPLNNYSPLVACTADLKCVDSAPTCASGAAKCVSGFPGTTTKFCSFVPTLETAGGYCPCFEGQREICYVKNTSGKWIEGTRTCNVTSPAQSAWNTCIAL